MDDRDMDDRDTGADIVGIEESESADVAEPDGRPPKPHAPESRFLHAVDRIASRPRLAVVLITADVAWVLISLAFDFPSRLEVGFETVVAAITLAMVFVIQHTQARQEAVTQRKLDEILRALPAADNALITLEEAPDSELHAVTEIHREARARATDTA
jgi:low affinity Fe/Cu permease